MQTRLGDIDVYPGYPLSSPEGDLRLRPVLDLFVKVANEAAQLLSWYLRESGGIPANHSFVRVVAQASSQDVGKDQAPSPLTSDFEEISILADFSILSLSGNRQEHAALRWLYSGISAIYSSWGSDTTGLEIAYSAAIAGDPDLARRGSSERRTNEVALALVDRVFWNKVAILDGLADADGCEELARSLARDGEAAIDAFEIGLHRALAVLDRFENSHAVISDISEPHEVSVTSLSDDTFLYARCAVVASGFGVWQNVVKNPAAFRGQWDLNAERLLEVSEAARNLLE